MTTAVALQSSNLLSISSLPRTLHCVTKSAAAVLILYKISQMWYGYISSRVCKYFVHMMYGLLKIYETKHTNIKKIVHLPFPRRQ